VEKKTRLITLANQSFSDISGYGSEELIGQKHRINGVEGK
jgi:PAS domain S-box-containing protein